MGIVRSHRGTLSVESAPGHGTTFTVLLPAAADRSLPPTPARADHNLRGSGTVLVADDEDTVRMMARAALEHFGYRVLLARKGREAVDMLQSHDEIGVVLLDMTMPVMSGQEAFLHMREIRPEHNIIISSGFNEAETVRRFTSHNIAAFIQKPYTAMQLAEVVKKVREA